MSEIRKSIFLEDGRRGERRIIENQIDDCSSEVVTELHEEKPLPKYLTTRIIETKKPMVVARETHLMGEDGETVVETRKESLEPDYKLHLREINTVQAPPDSTSIKQAVADALAERDASSKKGIRGESPCRGSQFALGEGAPVPVVDPKKLTPWDLAGIMIILLQIGAVVYFSVFF